MARYASLWATAETFFSESHTGAVRKESWRLSYNEVKTQLSDPNYQSGVYGLHLFRQALYVAKALQILIYGAMTKTVGDNIIEERVAEIAKEMEDQACIVILAPVCTAVSKMSEPVMIQQRIVFIKLQLP